MLVFYSLFIVLLCLATSLSAKKILFGSPLDSRIELLGRYDLSSSPSKYPRANWSGSGLRFKLLFDGIVKPKVSITFGNVDGGLYYLQAYVDGQSNGVFSISPATVNTLEFEINIPSTRSGQHVIEFYKRTEAHNGDATGIMELVEMEIIGAELLSKELTVRKKFLFFGDSLTAAYGVEGTNPCPFTASTENVMEDYSAIVARNYSADFHVVAWSGKGVVRNYGDPNQMSVDPLPLYYNRTIGTSTLPYWNPKDYPADMVYVMLGSNDYSTDPVPSDDQFIGGLTNFLNQIKFDYPNAVVVAASAPQSRKNQAPNIAKAAANANVNYLFLDPSAYNGGQGCDGHPNVQTQLNMANMVIPFLETLKI